MWGSILDWSVIGLPILAGAYEALFPHQRQTKRHRTASAIGGLVLSGLVFWQQHRTREVHNREMEELRTQFTKLPTKDDIVGLRQKDPSISFVDRKTVRFNHNLNTPVPQVKCFDTNGRDLTTWDGYKVIDANTVLLEWSKLATGTCSAR